MNAYLITGVSGFLGGAFARYLLQREPDALVVGVDLDPAGMEISTDPRYAFVQADICDPVALDRVFTDFAPECVVNFAAETGRAATDYVSSNIDGLITLMQCAKDDWEEPDGSFGNKRFIQISSDEVYGSLPLDNLHDVAHENTLLRPATMRAASKASADMIALSLRATWGMDVRVARLSNVYGPGQTGEALFPTLIQACLDHEPLRIYDEGRNMRDWLYVDDVCAGIQAVLDHGGAGQIYNIGGRNEWDDLTVANIVIAGVSAALSDPLIDEHLIRFVADHPTCDARHAASINKARIDLGWKPQTTFEDGIVGTIEWYLLNR